MVMQSGVVPYEYAHGGRRFESKPIPLGLSGILLEQAQFVITAEIRKWIGDYSDLQPFNVYINTDALPSGQYEPKANGTTLDNALNPGAVVFVDHILECRAALNVLLNLYEADTDLDTYQYRAGWLQALFPESTSGFINGSDDQAFFTGIGHWRHRRPSEIGIIDYVSDEVLGASGVLYDIDFSEVMFNPAPHIAGLGFDEAHGLRVNNTNDTFAIQQYPVFPAFQKTDGSIIDLNGREPANLSTYRTSHVSSGALRLHGYMLRPQTKLMLSRERTFGSDVDFTIFSEGIRAPYNPNVPTTLVFITPTSQGSGVYRIGAANRFVDFPNATIESGIFSHWPPIEVYWPSDHPTSSTTTTANGGYHVFNDCIWMTDVSLSSSFGGPNFGYPSGLAVLSPYTGHRMWLRYADMTPIDIDVFGGINKRNWGTGKGLERVSSNNIYRVAPIVAKSTPTPTSGQFVFGCYNDNLDLVTTITTISSSPNGDNLFPLGGAVISLSDFWFNGSNYFVANAEFVGFDLWKLDSSFSYVTKYVFNRPSGIHNARGAYVNGQDVLFYFVLNNAPGDANFATSGIFPINFIDEGSDPFDNSANLGPVGEAEISPATAKYINGAAQLGVAQTAEIMDLFEVTSSTHVVPGVYAIVRFKLNTNPFNGGDLYLLRLQETSTAWEIVALTRLETAVNSFMPRRELLYMGY